MNLGDKMRFFLGGGRILLTFLTADPFSCLVTIDSFFTCFILRLYRYVITIQWFTIISSSTAAKLTTSLSVSYSHERDVFKSQICSSVLNPNKKNLLQMKTTSSGHWTDFAWKNII